jgi:hypothetical protein
VAIKDPYLKQRFSDVDQSILKASSWGLGDPELNAYLAGYLVVLISGVYEDCIEHLVNERASRTNDKELSSYVRERTQRTFMNPNTRNILGLLERFSKAYKKRFIKRVNSKSRSAIDSIVDNKNWLAHGDTGKFQVTVRDVDGYFRRSARAIEVVEDIIG